MDNFLFNAYISHLLDNILDNRESSLEKNPISQVVYLEMAYSQQNRLILDLYGSSCLDFAGSHGFT